jgi:ceramide glucosyltransferase
MLHILLALAVIGLITSTGFCCIVLWAVPGYLRERRVAEDAIRSGHETMPPLTLLKPLHGAEPGLEAHLDSFFVQDYPVFEILFGAQNADDAGIAIARAVAARHPHVPVQFITVADEPDYINAKAASMERMEAAATHDILVISDSDVSVTPGYLRAVALPFSSSQVGASTCPYRGVAVEGGLWARLEAVGMSVEMTSGVLAARAMEGMQFVLGPTMTFRRETIRQMGGFRVTADYCADDFVLGNEAYKLGKTVVLSHHAIDHIVINSSFMASMKHQIRWMKSTRFSRPAGHFSTALSFSVPYGVVACAAAWALGHAGWGLGLLGWSIATRVALALAVGRLVLHDKSWFNLLVLYPVRDLMGFLFWMASYWGSRIHWRGRVFELLPGGKMRAVK